MKTTDLCNHVINISDKTYYKTNKRAERQKADFLLNFYCYSLVSKLNLLTSRHMRTNASLLPGNAFQLTGSLLPAGSLRG